MSPRKIKAVYLAGPFTAKDRWGETLNVMTARVYAEELMRKGYVVYSPHLQNYGSGLSWDDIMELDLEMLCRCDILALLPGWEHSRGSRMEYSKAIECGMTIYNSPLEVPNV